MSRPGALDIAARLWEDPTMSLNRPALLPHQRPPEGDWTLWLLQAGRGCVAPWTRIYDAMTGGHRRIEDIHDSISVLTLEGIAATEGPPFVKGSANMWTVRTEDCCEITVTSQHRFLTPQGWRQLAEVRPGQLLAGGAPTRQGGGSTVQWTPIASVEYSHCGVYYDLTVPGAEHYAAEGLWHHNSGKTEACSRYFSRWMREHPGARGRIIAPTFADAVESCITGPSGLLAVDPQVKFKAVAPGGSKVLWPNGSEALVIGTYSKPDVERLRAGGNRHCFVAGTPVLTEDGWRPIEQIRVGERVQTRQGLNRVERAGLTGVCPTWRLTTEGGRVLVGTADHPIATDSGWTSMSLLAPGDMLHIWSQQSSGADITEASLSTGRAEPVYDLTVEDCPEFIAAGIIAHNCDWWEEMAANRQLADAWDQAQLGLRLGDHPHSIASTTPRRTPAFEAIAKLPGTVITRATMWDNPYTADSWRKRMEATYKGTRLGRQEISGELLEDVENALWSPAMIAAVQLGHPVPEMVRTVLSIDPSGSDQPGRETGIVTAGKGKDGALYVLADDSCGGRPEHRYETACLAAAREGAGLILVEGNYGGDNCRALLRSSWDHLVRKDKIKGLIPRIKAVNARGSKADRAEPVAGLYEQHAQGTERIWHARPFEELENQQLTWDPADDAWSPDRLDALVHVVRYLSPDLLARESSGLEATVGTLQRANLQGGRLAMIRRDRR